MDKKEKRFIVLRALFITGITLNILLYFVPTVIIRENSEYFRANEWLSDFAVAQRVIHTVPGMALLTLFWILFYLLILILALHFPKRWVFLIPAGLILFGRIVGILNGANPDVQILVIPKVLSYIAAGLTLVGFFIKPPILHGAHDFYFHKVGDKVAYIKWKDKNAVYRMLSPCDSALAGTFVIIFIGVGFFVLAAVGINAARTPMEFGRAALLPGIMGAVFLVAYLNSNVYRIWKFCRLSKIRKNRLNPLLAALLLFIPGINLIWAFFAYTSTVEHLNNVQKELGCANYVPGSKGLEMATWIFFILSFFPPFILSLIFVVLFLVLMQKWRTVQFSIMGALASRNAITVE